MFHRCSPVHTERLVGDYYKMLFCVHWETVMEHNPDGSDDCEVCLQQVTSKTLLAFIFNY